MALAWPKLIKMLASKPTTCQGSLAHLVRLSLVGRQGGCSLVFRRSSAVRVLESFEQLGLEIDFKA